MPGDDLDVGELRAAFTKNYVSFQYKWIEFFAEHLCDACKIFDGDLTKMLIVAILGQRYLGSLMALRPVGGVDDVLPEDHDLLERPTMAASRLADISGRPRQSIRRKLDELRSLGWVEQVKDGWKLSASGPRTQVYNDLVELDRRGIDRIATLVATLTALARDEAQATGSTAGGRQRPSSAARSGR